MIAALAFLKGRLALIGLAVGLAVIAGLWFRLDHLAEKRAEAEAAKEIALAANAAQSDTIARLQAQAISDAKLLGELAGLRTAIRETANTRTAERRQIAEENPDARDFLSMPIPDSLREPAGGDPDGGGED